MWKGVDECPQPFPFPLYTAANKPTKQAILAHKTHPYDGVYLIKKPIPIKAMLQAKLEVAKRDVPPQTGRPTLVQSPLTITSGSVTGGASSNTSPVQMTPLRQTPTSTPQAK